jgi:hypothetical protein
MTLGRTTSGAIKIKSDDLGGGLRAVECACCGPCAGCPALTTKIDDVTSVTIGGTVSDGKYFTYNLPAQTVEIIAPFTPVQYSNQDLGANVIGTASGSLCGAGNSAKYDWRGTFFGSNWVDVGVNFSFIKNDGVCKVLLSAFYSFGGDAFYTAHGSGGKFIQVANLIGTHSFLFPVAGCRVGSGCSTSIWVAEITIS